MLTIRLNETRNNYHGASAKPLQSRDFPRFVGYLFLYNFSNYFPPEHLDGKTLKETVLYRATSLEKWGRI